MARSKYIYLIREKATGKLLSAFTVKHEAKAWVIKVGWKFDEVYLTSMRDGFVAGVKKTELPLFKWE